MKVLAAPAAADAPTAPGKAAPRTSRSDRVNIKLVFMFQGVMTGTGESLSLTSVTSMKTASEAKRRCRPFIEMALIEAGRIR
jgi:hypothetical protein